MRKPLGIKEAAALIGVSRVTLRKWDKDGILKASYTNGGHRRYRLNDLLEFCGDDENEKILSDEVDSNGTAERVLEGVNDVLIAELQDKVEKLTHENEALMMAKRGVEEVNKVLTERLQKATEVYNKQKEQILRLKEELKKAQAK